MKQRSQKSRIFKSLFLDITETKYRKLNRISYSAMSSFDIKGPAGIIKEVVEDQDVFAFGSLVDELLLEQDSNFDDKFFIFNGTTPTSSLLVLAKAVLRMKKPVKGEDIELVSNIAKGNKLWAATKDPIKYVAKFNTAAFWGYIKAKQNEAAGKYLIDTNMWSRGQEKVNLLLTHKYSKDLFENVNEDDSFTQLKGEVTLFGIAFKFMLDLLKIDHVNKTIRIIDLKTTSSKISQFKSSFYKWRYWIQASMYRLAIVELMKGTQFEEYEVLPFEFIIINSWGENAPVKYIFPIELQDYMESDWESAHGYKNKGYKTLITELNWHLLNNESVYTKEAIDNNGYIKLTL